jgi:hypothetical protein
MPAGTPPAPKAEIDQALSYDFGAMRTEQKGRYAWTVKNAGQADLELWLVKRPECGCTVASLKEGGKEVVKPGQAMEIAMEWRVIDHKEHYAQTAVIGTNDPRWPQLELHVLGRIYSPVEASAQAVIFDTIFNEEPQRSSIAITSPDRSDLAVTGIITSRPDLITATATPLSPEECKTFKAMSGYRVVVDLKPGMPLGRFNEVMILKTSHPERPELTVNIMGTATGPISVLSPHLLLPAATRPTALSRVVYLLVHDDRPTQFKVTHQPKNVLVAIAADNAPKGQNPGKRRYRLTATVPSGAALKPGREIIILATDHPKAAALMVPVTVAGINQMLPTGAIQAPPVAAPRGAARTAAAQ